MTASYSNRPLTHTLRHQPAELCQLGATLFGSPWISGRRSHFVCTFKWVLRYSPSETKIQTPVCASCAESFGQPCQTCTHASEWKNHKWNAKYCEGISRFRAFIAKDRCHAYWDGLTPSSLG